MASMVVFGLGGESLTVAQKAMLASWFVPAHPTYPRPGYPSPWRTHTEWHQINRQPTYPPPTFEAPSPTGSSRATRASRAWRPRPRSA